MTLRNAGGLRNRANSSPAGRVTARKPRGNDGSRTENRAHRRTAWTKDFHRFLPVSQDKKGQPSEEGCPCAVLRNYLLSWKEQEPRRSYTLFTGAVNENESRFSLRDASYFHSFVPGRPSLPSRGKNPLPCEGIFFSRTTADTLVQRRPAEPVEGLDGRRTCRRSPCPRNRNPGQMEVSFGGKVRGHFTELPPGGSTGWRRAFREDPRMVKFPSKSVTAL